MSDLPPIDPAKPSDPAPAPSYGPPPGYRPSPAPGYPGPGGWRMPPPQYPRRSGFPWVVLIVLGILGVGGCGFMMLAAAIGGGAGGAGGKHKLIEETVEGEGSDKIVMLSLDGVIMRGGSGGLFGGAIDPVEQLCRQLEQAREDTSVKAVLLTIDSPGGAVTASDEIHHELGKLKAKGKKVVVLMGSMCASGGVYIAVAGDKIVCQPTTITGSIGVILSGYNFHELGEKYGVKGVTVTSGPNKDLLNPLAPVRESHMQILQTICDDAYARFVKLVAEGRGLDEDTVKSFADGRILTPTQALNLKLVDAIGYEEDAIALARQLVSLGPTSRLVRYTRPPNLADVLAGNALGSIPTRIDAPALIDQLRSPRLMALWQPW